MDEIRLIYCPDTDVVQVSISEYLRGQTVAVPLEDMTILVSEDLDRIVGIDILDMPSFVQQAVSDALIPGGITGEELFEAAKPHLSAIMSMLARNLGPIAKEKVRAWDESVRQLAS